ncbi:MAG: hypothetical protein AB1810_02990 [Pseudomonadota bacterium]
MSKDYENLIMVMTFLFMTVIAVAIFDAIKQVDPGRVVPVGARETRVDPYVKPDRHAHQAREIEVARRFDQAVMMLHAKRYDMAVTALHRVLELSPRMPEAHANMGFALLGLEQYGAAHDFFTTAIELRPPFANAYYGLAMAFEGMGEYEMALGAMRSYMHLATEDTYMAKARAALWEWERKLGRIPESESPAPAPEGKGGGSRP